MQQEAQTVGALEQQRSPGSWAPGYRSFGPMERDQKRRTDLARGVWRQLSMLRRRQITRLQKLAHNRNVIA